MASRARRPFLGVSSLDFQAAPAWGWPFFLPGAALVDAHPPAHKQDDAFPAALRTFLRIDRSTHINTETHISFFVGFCNMNQNEASGAGLVFAMQHEGSLGLS